MSLYYDAATFFATTSSKEGSLKSRIFKNGSNLKSAPATIYALIAETAKYDTLLTEVIDKAGILALEPKLTPLLSLFLVHDQLFSKKGIAASTNHPLRLAIERNKARLQAELTKCRLRRGCASVEELKKNVAQSEKKMNVGIVQPRWIRVNGLKSTQTEQLSSTFKGYVEASTISELNKAGPDGKAILVDENIPDLLAIPAGIELSKTQAYRNGQIIFQDKASCFPAYLLLGDMSPSSYPIGDILDACAAPGNKTTHLASLWSQLLRGRMLLETRSKIFACERDPHRSETLQTMVSLAGAGEYVTVLAKQDFLALDPNSARFENVTHLLLDPSCSGSGIVGREDIPNLVLPKDPKSKKAEPAVLNGKSSERSAPKKRKWGTDEVEAITEAHFASQLINQDNNIDGEEERGSQEIDWPRLEKLATLQSKIIEHAFAFPAARKIAYSTCSVHVQENEAVVTRALNSAIAKKGAWRVMRRDEQPSGLEVWKCRGVDPEAISQSSSPDQRLGLSEEERQGCIRCQPGDKEGTMGFFVCGFVRDEGSQHEEKGQFKEGLDEEVDEWGGFSDSD